ncbi:hypothetical protein AAG906_002494 [Vitis piasezkii]
MYYDEITETLVWRVLISLLQRPPTHPRNGHSNQHFQGDTITNHAPPDQKEAEQRSKNKEPWWGDLSSLPGVDRTML